MSTQPPYQGFSPNNYGAPTLAPLVPALAPAMLRPLSTGEVLDRTLALYRRNFWLFVGIGTLPATGSVLSTALRQSIMGTTMAGMFTKGPANPLLVQRQFGSLMRMEALFLPLMLVFLVLYGISKAATAFAVSELSQGRVPTAIETYRAVAGRWLRWTGIVFRQYWSMLWPIALGFGLFVGATALTAKRFAGSPALVGVVALVAVLLVFAGFVLGLINYLRVCYAEAAGVVENLGVNASLRRSRALAAGRKGRIFLAILLVYALYMVAGGLQFPFLLMAQTSRGAAHVLLLTGELVVSFVAMSLVLPVASIAFTLFYLDERVRREGYDIELLLQRNAAPTAVVTEL